MRPYKIEMTWNGFTQSEECESWTEVKFRIPFIRDVCGWSVKLFKRVKGEWKPWRLPNKVIECKQ